MYDCITCMKYITCKRREGDVQIGGAEPSYSPGGGAVAPSAPLPFPTPMILSIIIIVTFKAIVVNGCINTIQNIIYTRRSTKVENRGGEKQRKTERDVDRQTDRQTYRQTDRQTDRARGRCCLFLRSPPPKQKSCTSAPLLTRRIL